MEALSTSANHLRWGLKLSDPGYAVRLVEPVSEYGKPGSKGNHGEENPSEQADITRKRKSGKNS